MHNALATKRLEALAARLEAVADRRRGGGGAGAGERGRGLSGVSQYNDAMMI